MADKKAAVEVKQEGEFTLKGKNLELLARFHILIMFLPL